MNFLDIHVEGFSAAEAYAALSDGLHSLGHQERQRISLEVIERQGRGVEQAVSSLVAYIPASIAILASVISIIIDVLHARPRYATTQLEMVVEFEDGATAILGLPVDHHALTVQIGTDSDVSRIKCISIRRHTRQKTG